MLSLKSIKKSFTSKEGKFIEYNAIILCDSITGTEVEIKTSSPYEKAKLTIIYQALIIESLKTDYIGEGGKQC